MDLTEIQVGPDNTLSWEEAKKVLTKGDVREAWNSHSGGTGIRMADGTCYRVSEPGPGATWQFIKKLRKKGKEIPFAQE